MSFMINSELPQYDIVINEVKGFIRSKYTTSDISD